MYSEFIKGTGCKQTENNYKVFCNLEQMYMNTDMSKEEIYEYGKKLVDNSKTVEEIEFENNIKEQIAENRKAIKNNKERIEDLKVRVQLEYDAEWKKIWKQDIKVLKNDSTRMREENKMLKSIVA